MASPWRERVSCCTGQNSVHITYRLAAGQGVVRLKVRPSLHFRPHDAPVSASQAGPYTVTAVQNRYEVTAGAALPALWFFLTGDRGAFTIEERQGPDFFYRVEEGGYDFQGGLWTPGYFLVDLGPGRDATLSASTEPWETFLVLGPEAAGIAAERERRDRL